MEVVLSLFRQRLACVFVFTSSSLTIESPATWSHSILSRAAVPPS